MAGENGGYDFDVVVIGGGPGGYPCAIRAAQLGKKAAVIEADNPGGTCLNWGCIPTKTMIGSVDALHTIKSAKDFGLKAENVGVDFPALMARKEKIVKGLVGGVGYLFKKHGITHYEGFGAFVDSHTVEITKPDGSKERITGANVVIATGSVPTKLPVPGIADADIWTNNREVKLKFAAGTLASGKIWTSNEAVSANEIPGELVVVGGGVIGCEFAYTYNGLGSKVTVIEFLPRIIANMDADLSAELNKLLAKQGIKFHINAKVVSVTDGEGGKQIVTFEKDGKQETVSADAVLVATGRTPYVEGLNLEGIGVKIGSEKNKRAIAVNEKMETNVPGVFAIGDVTGSGLAHTATREGIVVAENIAGHHEVMDYKAIPSCIYTEPECRGGRPDRAGGAGQRLRRKNRNHALPHAGEIAGHQSAGRLRQNRRRQQVRRDSGRPYHRPARHRFDSRGRRQHPVRKHRRGTDENCPRPPHSRRGDWPRQRGRARISD